MPNIIIPCQPHISASFEDLGCRDKFGNLSEDRYKMCFLTFQKFEIDGFPHNSEHKPNTATYFTTRVSLLALPFSILQVCFTGFAPSIPTGVFYWLCLFPFYRCFCYCLCPFHVYRCLLLALSFSMFTSVFITAFALLPFALCPLPLCPVPFWPFDPSPVTCGITPKLHFKG